MAYSVYQLRNPCSLCDHVKEHNEIGKEMCFVKHYEEDIMVTAYYTVQLMFLWYRIKTYITQYTINNIFSFKLHLKSIY